MKKILSILCSFAFALSGVMMAITVSDPSPSTGYKSMSAATMPVLTYNATADTCPITLPQDLLLDLAKKNKDLTAAEQTIPTRDSAVVDSLKQRICELESKGPVTKVKWRRAPAPKPIVLRDTIREAHYYLATQVGNKEGPTGECISVYEVHKVDEICSGTTISSADGTSEYHIKASD